MLIHCAAPPTYKRDLDRVRTPLFFKTTTTTNNITHGKEFHGQALETLLEFHEYSGVSKVYNKYHGPKIVAPFHLLLVLKSLSDLKI